METTVDRLIFPITESLIETENTSNKSVALS